jgi:hypothetical protein
MADERRTKVLGIKVLPSTYEAQQRLATAAGLTLSAYLRARLGLECDDRRAAIER